jgi:hypothetical protein
VAGADGAAWSAALVARFDRLGTRLGTDLRITVECAVDDPIVRGQVLMLRSGLWTPIPCDDFGPGGAEFGFFAPAAGGEHETRRSFSLGDPAPLLGPDGSIQVMLLLSRPQAGTAPFHASVDLMQVVWTDDTGMPGYCSADYDRDGDSATDADIEAFFACLAGDCCDACSPDFNADGDERTDADIESFFRVLAGGSC